MDATRQRVYRRTGMWGACHADAPSGRPRVGERQVRALTGGAIANGKTKSIHSGSKPLRLTMKVGRSIAAEATWLMGKTCGGRTAVAQQCPRQSQVCAGASCGGPCGDASGCSLMDDGVAASR